MALKVAMVLVLTLSAFGIGGKLPRPTPKLQEPRTGILKWNPGFGNCPNERAMMPMIDQVRRCGYRPGTKIVGGNEATKGSWPWQAKLFTRRNSQYNLCGGTLVDNNWVVTAAHCTENAEAIYISPGAHCTNPACSDEPTFWASEIISHPSYNKYDSYTHDIAMLKLPSPARITDNVNLAFLPQSSVDVAVGKTCWVTGFGDTSPKSDVLMEVSFPIVSRATCQASYPYEDIDQSMICAGNPI